MTGRDPIWDAPDPGDDPDPYERGPDEDDDDVNVLTIDGAGLP